MGVIEKIYGQSIQTMYDNVHIGRNFSFTYHHPVSSTWEVYAGPKIFIDRPYSQPYHKIHSLDPQELKVFYKTFEAKKPIQHLGLRAGVLKKFYIAREDNAYVFVYFNTQYTSGYQHFKYFTPLEEYHTTPTGYTFMMYEAREIIKGPIKAYENYAGIGIHYHINKYIGFKGYSGLGWAHLRYDLIDPIYGSGYGDTHHNDFAVNWGVGLTFPLKSHRK